MSILLPDCPICRHYQKGTKKCPAFPEGIPEDIFYGRVHHVEPYPGDKGIQFEFAESVSENIKDWPIYKDVPR